MKFYAYVLSHSTAVLSDAIESIVNVVAASMALAVIHYASQPADTEHPYGHGKMEFFSAAFEGGLIFFASIVIGFEAVSSLIRGSDIKSINLGLLIMAAAGGINLLLGLYLRYVGRKYKSAALLGSGAHVLSDVWTTAGVLIGLALVLLTGWTWLDPVVALLVATQLGLTGIKIVRGSIGALIDEQDEQALKNLGEAISKHRQEGIINIHNLRIIRSGRFHHIDAHVVVPEFWDVAKTHERTQSFENAVVNDYEFEAEIAFHIDPCEQKYCSRCDLNTCPVRKADFVKLEPFSVAQIIRGPIVEIP